MKGITQIQYDAANGAEWKGTKVRNINPISNHAGELPAGTLFEVMHKHKGLTIRSIPCPCCGLSVTFQRVHPMLLAFDADQKGKP